MGCHPQHKPVAMAALRRKGASEQHALLLAGENHHQPGRNRLERNGPVERGTAQRGRLVGQMDWTGPQNAVGRGNRAQPPVGTLPAERISARWRENQTRHALHLGPRHVRGVHQRAARGRTGARPGTHRLPAHGALQRFRRDRPAKNRQCHRRDFGKRPLLHHATGQEAL